MRGLLASWIWAGAALIAAPALAADVVSQEIAPSASLDGAPAIYIWSGPYAGAFVGYNSTRFDQSGGASFDGDGVSGGVLAGYNLQTDRLVYGLEADLGAAGVDAGGFNTSAGLPVVSDDTNAFGSLRARVGVAADPFLLFATAGAAVSEKTLQFGPAEDSNTHFGYTVGAGIEAKITDSIDTRLEYRYSDFDSKDYDLGNTTVSSGFDEHSVRAGIALKF